jgi:hypothetical protein
MRQDCAIGRLGAFEIPLIVQGDRDGERGARLGQAVGRKRVGQFDGP